MKNIKIEFTDKELAQVREGLRHNAIESNNAIYSLTPDDSRLEALIDEINVIESAVKKVENTMKKEGMI